MGVRVCVPSPSSHLLAKLLVYCSFAYTSREILSSLPSSSPAKHFPLLVSRPGSHGRGCIQASYQLLCSRGFCRDCRIVMSFHNATLPRPASVRRCNPSPIRLGFDIYDKCCNRQLILLLRCTITWRLKKLSQVS